jgi:hypothetical protein
MLKIELDFVQSFLRRREAVSRKAFHGIPIGTLRADDTASVLLLKNAA